MTDDVPRSRLGDVLLRALESWSLKQRARADRLDISPAYVLGLMKGKNAMSVKTATRIADVLNFDHEEQMKLCRAAAQEHGFRLGLPDGF